MLQADVGRAIRVAEQRGAGCVEILSDGPIRKRTICVRRATNVANRGATVAELEAVFR